VEMTLLLLKIMMINIILSGDNAIVIALASNKLPDDQKKKAMWWGSALAVGLRLILVVVAVLILKVPYVMAIASLLLYWVAIKLLVDSDSHADIKSPPSLKSAIWTILIADFAMSLDNVLAIAATANDNIPLIFIGIILSFPIIIFGSNLVVKLLTKYPILIYLGSGILGYTAGEMLVSDKNLGHLLFGGISHHILTFGSAILVIVIASVIKFFFSRKNHEVAEGVI
jgi:YjbE family integral membrane protein